MPPPPAPAQAEISDSPRSTRTTLDAPNDNIANDHANSVVAAPLRALGNSPLVPACEPPPAFAAFNAWLTQWRSASVEARAELLAQGVEKARERRRRMADLMLSAPQQALPLALPYSARKGLPSEVAALLEEPVNLRASLSVVCVIPLPGRQADTPPMVRWMESGNRIYHVSTFGRGLNFVTQPNAPLNGFTLPAEAATNFPDNPVVKPDMILALDPTPARQIDAIEQSDLESSGRTIQTEGASHESSASLLVEAGGELHRFCCLQHAEAWSENLAASLDIPESARLMAAVGGSGSDTATAELPVAASGYTEGYKRFLFLRPHFTDSSSNLADTISDSRAAALMNELINHMSEMSWGRLKIAPQGPSGSQVTTALTINNTGSSYDNAGLSRLYPDARTAAQAAGYNLADYAFSAVFTNGRPAAGYAGLAYVGGIGIHIANGYYGQSVLTHELGHNLGLPHAHRWDTSDNSIIGDGTNVEYGNNYDPMGSGGDSMHYVAGHKAYLDWIPAAECSRITAAGTYRLHVCDESRNANGFRGLRLSRSGSQDYWLDYRQNIGGTEFDSGLILHFSEKDGRQSYRIDALPKQSGITLPVGMTFSDKTAGVHVTPMQVVPNSFPKAMDVAVGFTVAGNHAPTAQLIQHTTHAAAGATCYFTVEASDSDGDTLAYYWDFGDGSHSWDNLPEQSHAYSTDGEYAVHCVVSDTRGGVWRKTTVQKSGALPSNQVRISGRVVDGNSKPISGLWVSTDGGLYAWTDSDGSYALCRVPTGVHTVAAMDLVENKQAFSRTFSSSTNWTANTTGADLSLTEVAPEITTALVSKLATWKYNDTGADLGTTWRTASFSDTGWAEGPGMLGYGNGGEGTVISYGGNASNKRNCAYFRKKFTVANPSIFKELRLQCKRDDAVMVYLNGTKIYQDNFATGVDETNITYATTAADSTEPGTYQQQNGISKSLLVAGDNYLCAEVHQVEPTSSDLAFDAELSGIQDAPSPGAQAAYLTGPDGSSVIPSGSTSVLLTAEARARTATVTKVEFYVDGAKAGESTTAPYSAVWTNPPSGSHSLHVVASFSVGTPLTSAAVAVTVGTAPATLVTAGSSWRYRASTTAPPATWMNSDFNDTTWPAGSGQLGYGDGDETTNISPGGTKYPQTQFRRTFGVADPTAVNGLLCRLIRDDAALVYLNGVLAFRHNFRFDGSTWVAQGAGATDVENLWHSSPLATSLLRPGLNTLAVEIHQETPTSSDVSFDLSLSGEVATGRSRGIYLATPSAVILPELPVLEADALPGAALTVTKVEFYANGLKIGEDASYPFSFIWAAATPGTHVITAIGTDSAAATISGTSASLTVRPPSQATALVKWGDTWKYFDTGVDPGTNWMGRTSFDDSTWPEGLGRFGYGGDGEVTSLFVNDAGVKPATVYFRKKFTVPDPAAYDALRLRVIRDDSISVQLNRVELLRDNLPEGVLSFSTLAAAGAADEQTPVEIVVPTTSLRAGENQLAVEVHQVGINSSDLSFDMELLGLKSPTATPAVWLTSPAAGEVIFSSNPLQCAVSSSALPAAIQRVEYYVGAAKIGQSTIAPWTYSWTSALKGTYAVSAKVHLANGNTLATSPAVVTISSPTVVQDLIWSGSDWRFLDTGVAPSATWATSSFNDSTWSSGRSRLGFGGDGETTYVTPGHTTYWFRKTFSVPSGLVLAGANLRVIRDDGVQLFLNGNRIWLDNLPDGASPTDFAINAVANADEQTWYSVPLAVSALQTGNNVLAAEVHQSGATSSDVAFDLELTISWLTTGGFVNSAPVAAPTATLRANPGGDFTFSFPDSSGRIYLIESSTNLSNWTVEGTYFTTGAGLSLPFPPNGPRRYYRAKWQSTP